MPLSEYGVTDPLHQIKAELFKALAHPARVRALELLADGEQPVSQLLTQMHMEASHLSQHLAILRRAGLVSSKREGKTVIYRLSGPAVSGLLSDARTVLIESFASASVALDLPQTPHMGTHPDQGDGTP